MKQTYLKKAFKLFSAYKADQLTSDDLSKADAKASNLDDKVIDFKVIIDRPKDISKERYQVNTLNAALRVGTSLNVISPNDAIPDLIPVLVCLDDITIVGYA